MSYADDDRCDDCGKMLPTMQLCVLPSGGYGGFYILCPECYDERVRPTDTVKIQPEGLQEARSSNEE